MMPVLTSETAKKIGKLRHAEYYDMTDLFDELYDKSKNNFIFSDLMSLITKEENIRLAYRNIKRNSGSITPGVDKLNINDFEKLSQDDIVQRVRDKLAWYKPKPVKRKLIPKGNGKFRPLGIPTFMDRLVQQCILQILEPICEAKFYAHSYGFRPNRSTQNALAECYRQIQLQGMFYVVSVDIEGFFDNVNHTKLIKQIWGMGIRDKKLLCIISEMLKAPIIMPDKTRIIPTKGTPQGGILSPLLANIVLNELDWWIWSQWEGMPTKHKYATGTVEGVIHNGGRYNALRKHTNLKEMHIIRYADDFLIFCKKRSDAVKIAYAVEQWLLERLKLNTNREKTRIVNLKKSSIDYLGFTIKAVPKRNKYVVKSNMSQKAMMREHIKLSQQIKRIQHCRNVEDNYVQISLYNSMVMGIHNYYQFATHISQDCRKIAYSINLQLQNRIKLQFSSEGRASGQIEARYGKSKQLRFILKWPLAPIGYIKHKSPSCKRRKACPYTQEGRKYIHCELGINTHIMQALMRMRTVNRTIEYTDNRISLYAAQYGKCAVTGKVLDLDEIHCHHKKPLKLGGTDRYNNLIIVHMDVHRLIHATDSATINAYLCKLELDYKMLAKINKLRETAELPPIKR